MRILAKSVLENRTFDLEIDCGRLVARTESTAPAEVWFAPSFCDPQINGCLGHSFSDPDTPPEGLAAITTECTRHGIGQFLPTVITGSRESMIASFQNLSRHRDPAWLGYHLEGPYISGLSGARGAHPEEHARDPDWEEFLEFQAAAQGNIRMVTLASERIGAIPFIRKLTQAGVIVALGHTTATGEQISAAVDAGASVSTHLGNGCAAVLPRHPNVIWDQLGEDRLWASVIADGHHLPVSVLKSILRAKTIPRLFLTCDVGPLAGMPPGRYRNWGNDLEVLDSGKIVVSGTPFLAGSGHFTDTCATNLLNMGSSLGDVIELGSLQPRRILSVNIEDAPMMIFRWKTGTAFRVEHVFHPA